jgi:UDP-N-acetylglucosamine 2-epimerase (non-hydrolysing)
VEAGVAKLVGPDRQAIVGAVGRLLDDPVAYAGMAAGISPYGDGKAAARIVAVLEKDLHQGGAEPSVAAENGEI